MSISRKTNPALVDKNQSLDDITSCPAESSIDMLCLLGGGGGDGGGGGGGTLIKIRKSGGNSESPAF